MLAGVGHLSIFFVQILFICVVVKQPGRMSIFQIVFFVELETCPKSI